MNNFYIPRRNIAVTLCMILLAHTIGMAQCSCSSTGDAAVGSGNNPSQCSVSSSTGAPVGPGSAVSVSLSANTTYTVSVTQPSGGAQVSSFSVYTSCGGTLIGSSSGTSPYTFSTGSNTIVVVSTCRTGTWSINGSYASTQTSAYLTYQRVTPTPSASSTTLEYCSGTACGLTVSDNSASGTNNTTTYAWSGAAATGLTYGTGSGTTTSSGTTSAVNPQLNTTATQVTATFTITAANGTCSASSFTNNVKVDGASAVGTPSANPYNFCSNSGALAAGAVTLTSGTIGTAYWSQKASNGTTYNPAGASSGPNASNNLGTGTSSPAETFTVPTASSGTNYTSFQIAAKNGVCPYSATTTVTVNNLYAPTPTPSVTGGASTPNGSSTQYTYCSAATTPSIILNANFSSAPSDVGGTITWYTGGTCTGTQVGSTVTLSGTTTTSYPSTTAIASGSLPTANSSQTYSVLYTPAVGGTPVTTGGCATLCSSSGSPSTVTVINYKTPAIGTGMFTVAGSTTTPQTLASQCGALSITATPDGTANPTANNTNYFYTTSPPSPGSGVLSGGTASPYTYTPPSFPYTNTYYVTSYNTSSQCESTPIKVTVTVNDNQKISLTSGSLSPSAFCQYVALPTNIVFSLSGSATNASVSGLPTGMSGTLTGSSSPYTYTISGTPNTSAAYGSFPYTITTSGANCTANTATGTITVQQAPTPSISFAGNPCTGSTIKYSTQAGNTTYTWTYSGTSGTTYTITGGGTTSSTATTVSWIQSGNQTVSVNYQNSNGCWAGTAASQVLNINASPTAATISDHIDPCNGGHSEYAVFSGGTAPYGFTLQPTNAAGTAIGSATGYNTGTTYGWPVVQTTNTFEINPAGALGYIIASITDNNNCSAQTIAGSPVIFGSRGITPGTTSGVSSTCSIPNASGSLVFYDASGYLMASITAGAAALGSTVVTVTQDASCQSVGGPTNKQHYLQRHYRIQPTTTTSAGSTVCIYMTEAESDALATASAGDKHTAPDFYGTFPSPAASLTAAAMQSGARIVKYDGGTGATSTQETPTNNSTRSVITSITATHNPTVDGYQYNGIWQLCFGLNTFSGFYVYASTTHDQYALPVTLVTFTAEAVSNKFIQLSWETASEIESSGFQIERSTDGTNFEAIGWVEGQGTKSTATDYQFADLTALPGVVYYYRLKEVDINGNFTYSNLASAALMSGDKGFILESMYPNPANSEVSIGIIATTNTPAVITMTDMLGREVMRQDWSLSLGYNINKFDITTIPNGTYVVSISSGILKVTSKLVITK